MSVDPKSERVTLGQLHIALQRLASRYPFHVAVLERLRHRVQRDVGTMAVAVEDDQVVLSVNPEFVLATPLDQLVGVLLHEVHHILFGHVTADPADYPDEWARTVAEEVTANEFVKEPLPGVPITLKQFPELPPDESTDERYRRLSKRQARCALKTPSPPQVGGKQTGTQESSIPGNGSQETGDSGAGQQSAKEGKTGKAAGQEKGDDDTLYSATGKKKTTASKTGGGQGREEGNTLVDDHSVWQSTEADRGQAARVVKELLQSAAEDVGGSNVPDAFRSVLEGLGIGKNAGGAEQALSEPDSGQVPWNRLLRRYVGSVLQSQPDFLRPPRRFPNLVGIVPGRRRRGTKPRIMAVIDTSGSITDETLDAINGELVYLGRDHDVLVVECDAEIHGVYAYSRIESVGGRGGTDLRPPFAVDFLRKHKPDLMIYFTDGEGPAPDRPSRVPTVWCLTPGGTPPADWGRIVRMPFQTS